jgi:uncharacterized damage-inducible protein DinB
MSLSAALLPEFDHEMANTRKVLERVPEAHLGWKPHAKSMSMAELSTHLAAIPGWISFTVHTDFMDMSSPTAPPRPELVKSRKELLDRFDQAAQEGRKALEGASDACMQGSWSLRAGDKTLFTLPRTVVLRSFIMSHSIHHRAQLEVYLRLKDVPLPAIYGPSADEANM